MCRKFLKFIGVALIAIFFLSVGDVYAESYGIYNRKKMLKIAVKSKKMINLVNEPVEISIIIRNMVDEAIEMVEPAIDEKSFVIEITMPDGKKDSLIDIYGLKLKTIRLYPKKRVVFKTEFTPEFTGNYDVNVKYNGFVEERLEAEPITVFVVNSKGDN